MKFVSDHFWIIPIAISFFNGNLINSSSKEYTLLKPELEVGYKKLITYTILYANIPWIIMAIGDLIGLANTDDYIHIKRNNFMVVAFYISMVLGIGLVIKWIYFSRGAEFIESHPAKFSINDWSSKIPLKAIHIKIFFGIAIVACLAAISHLWLRE